MEPGATAVMEQPPTATSFLGSRRDVPLENPHATRYAYMPGVWNAKSDPLKTGYAFFPQGELIKLDTFTRGGVYNARHIGNGKESPSIQIDVTAQDALEMAMIDMAAFEEVSNGFAALKSILGRDDAQKYFDAIHPAFSSVETDTGSYKCPFGLEVCPSCRIELTNAIINSDELAAKLAGLDTSTAYQLASEIISSCNSYKSWCETAWADISQKQELAKSQQGTVVIGREHHHWRKCAHIHTAQEMDTVRLTSIAQQAAGGGQSQGIDVNALREQIKRELREEMRPQTEAVVLPPITVGAVVREIATDARGVVRRKPGGRYTIDCAGTERTLTREEIEEVHNEA